MEKNTKGRREEGKEEERKGGKERREGGKKEGRKLIHDIHISSKFSTE
jgi:hypothetical protein